MPRYFRNKLLLVKREVTYGLDVNPAAATDAVLCKNVTLTPMENEMVDRDLVRSYLGHDDQLSVATLVRLSFDVEAVGSGAAGTAPAWGTLLRACGMSETVSAGVSVAYKPVSGSFDSASIYMNIDGKQHKMLGARGTVSVDITPKSIPSLKFEFTGLYVLPTDTAIVSPTLTAWKTPLASNNANTSLFQLHTYAGIMHSLTAQLANSIITRNLVGEESVQIMDRAPTGEVMIDDPTMAQKDFFTIAKNATLGALTITHGTVAGFKVKFDAPAAQIINPAYEERDGIVALRMGLRFVPTAAGNDEFVITNT